MYSRSEVYPEIDGHPMPITLTELRIKGVEIPGQDVALRPLRIEDAQAYFDLVSYDPDHLSHYGDTTARKYQTVDAVVKSIEDPDNEFKLRFGIWNNDSVMVGSINLTPGENNTAEIGYWVGKQHLGYAYAEKALHILTDFAFRDLGYDKLTADAERDNIASRKTLAKCGYAETGEVIGRFLPNEQGEETPYQFVVYSKERPGEHEIKSATRARELVEMLTLHANEVVKIYPTSERYAEAVRAKVNELKILLETGSGEVTRVIAVWRDEFLPIAEWLFGGRINEEQANSLAEIVGDYTPTVLPGIYARVHRDSLDEIMGPMFGLDFLAQSVD